MSERDLDWDDLRYLLAAARAGTLAGAARMLGVEHTTIGRRLSALERALGGSLVLRKPDGLTLTAMGERVVQAAEQVERAVSRVTDAASSEQTRVRLAVPSGFAGFFTSQLEVLRSRQPGTALELISGAQAVDLKRGVSDLAVRLGPIQDPDLVARRLCTVGWSLYGSGSYLARKPLHGTTLNLSGHHLIGYDGALGETPAARWIEQHAIEGTVVVRSREMVDMLGAAESGAGLALLPCFLGNAAAGLTRVSPEVLVRRDLWLVYRREVRASASVKAAAAFVLHVIEAASAQLEGEG